MSKRKLSSLLPAQARPWARSLGREKTRGRLAVRDAMLAVDNALGRGIKHVHGPTNFQVGAQDLTVLCLVRNGAAHLPTFLRYYKSLGVRHIIFIDNGSGDDTLKIAGEFPAATVFSSTLPFSGYQTAFKRWMVKHFMKSGWVLVADSDELFDYPYSDRLELSAFLGYLNSRGYDAVTAQNLEMFPRESIAEIQGRQIQNLEETHRYYDLSDIRQVRDQYWLEENQFDSGGHFTHTGGVWETIFGYTGSKLTKQPLFRYSERMKVFPYDPHFVTGARIADVTAAFRHYKYTGRFVAHVKEELQRKQYYGNAEIFEHYKRALEINPDLSLYRDTAVAYAGAAALLENGFLLASSAYVQWVADHDARAVRELTAT